MAKGYELVRLEVDEVHFDRRGETLSLTMADGTYYPRVVLRCCFPVADERQFLSVRDASLEEQPEIGVIEDWTALRDPDRQAVAAELGLYYFVPAITQVLDIKNEFGFLYWKVQTDKGMREFVMRNSVVHYAREVGPGRWLLIDVNQARWEISNLAALDARSQKLVAQALYL